MAGDAFVVFNGLMFHFGGSDLLLRIFVALEAELAVWFAQQLLVLRLMRVVAGSAFVVLDGLMFDFSGCELLLNVVMAFKAELPIRL